MKHQKFIAKVWDGGILSPDSFHAVLPCLCFFLARVCVAPSFLSESLKPLITGNYLFMLVYFFSGCNWSSSRSPKPKKTWRQDTNQTFQSLKQHYVRNVFTVNIKRPWCVSTLWRIVFISKAHIADNNSSANILEETRQPIHNVDVMCASL